MFKTASPSHHLPDEDSDSRLPPQPSPEASGMIKCFWSRKVRHNWYI